MCDKNIFNIVYDLLIDSDIQLHLIFLRKAPHREHIAQLFLNAYVKHPGVWAV